MLLRQIRYFISVVDHNSFSEAAEDCFISQSAISQQIQALEKEIGVELLLREKRKIQITPAGEYVYRNGKRLLQDADAIVKEANRIGSDQELQLRIGYISCYNGKELQCAIAEFARLYPEVTIRVVNGTHEVLYGYLRTNEVDMVINDQRRAFSDEYVNFELIRSDCYVEISERNKLRQRDYLTLDDLKGHSCILISSKDQQNQEQDYYQNTLGFHDDFIFAENIEEGRLMVLGNQGFLPIENVGTLPEPVYTIKRLPLYQREKKLQRNYYAFWKKENSNYYIEEFANILKRLLHQKEHCKE